MLRTAREIAAPLLGRSEEQELLTAKELQIAQLAGEGLSNREIGQRLYLSRRTISTHPYRTFPKLGITSRAELSAALARPASEPRGATQSSAAARRVRASPSLAARP